MSRNDILLSIRPQYATKIFEGQKTVELRRVRPKRIQKGSLALIYVSSPVQSLAGAFMIDEVIEQPINELWQNVRHKAGVTHEEFNSYYDGVSTGIGICFSEVRSLSEPIELQNLKKQMGFHPPQGFRYATESEMEIASNQLPDLYARSLRQKQLKLPLTS